MDTDATLTAALADDTVTTTAVVDVEDVVEASPFDSLVLAGDELIFTHSANAGYYRSRGRGTELACRVVIDEGQSRVEVRNGDLIRIRTAVIAIRRSEAFAPVDEDTVRVGSTVWRLLNRMSRDASVTTMQAEAIRILQTSADGYQDGG